jgi:hypothetical protein
LNPAEDSTPFFCDLCPDRSTSLAAAPEFVIPFRRFNKQYLLPVQTDKHSSNLQAGQLRLPKSPEAHCVWQL